MSSYKIRPHHGLCIQFFRGEGYSPEFIENMTCIIKKLEKNPEICLVSGADDFCATCPNRMGEFDCKSDEKVRRYDAAVLDLCGLKTGEKLLWQDFSQRVHSQILDRNLREEVCGGCQWTELCC